MSRQTSDGLSNELTIMTRKSILPLLAALLLLAPASVRGDVYTTLWKQYDAAAKQDQPATERGILDRIIATASAQAAWGHLIKAQSLRSMRVVSVSPDSLAGEVARLDSLMRATPSVCARSIYAAIICKIYESRARHDLEMNRKWSKYVLLAMAQPDTLAAVQALDYTPALVKGLDSRIFGGDLLHVIGMETGHISALHKYYAAHGNRRATCVLDAIAMQKISDYKKSAMTRKQFLHRIDSLISAYGDLQEAGELAIIRYFYEKERTEMKPEEQIQYINRALSRWGSWPHINVLRNEQAELTAPEYTMSLGDEVVIAGDRRTVRLNSIRNLNSITVNVYRLHSPHPGLHYVRTDSLPLLRRDMERVPVQTRTLTYYGRPAWQHSADTLRLEALPLGTYMVEAVTDNSGIAPQYELLRVTGLLPVWTAVPVSSGLRGDHKTRLAILDSSTGLPVAGARLERKERNGDNRLPDLVADERGEVELTRDMASSDMRAVCGDDRHSAWTSMYGWYGYNRNRYDHVRPRARIYTDRAIYRPGQTVHAAVLVYRMENDSTYKPVAGSNIKLRIVNTQGKTLEEASLRTDSLGNASADFTLPAGGLTGLHSLQTEGEARGYATVRVEEYRLPTYRVEIDEVKSRYAQGDTVTVSGRATTYAGVPVQGARVTYDATRKPAHWWWFRVSSDGDETVTRGTATTAADGSFQMRVPMTLPAYYNREARRFYNFQVHATVTDQAGESHDATRYVPLGTHATAFSADLAQRTERDSLRLTFRYKNAGGTDLPGHVSYTIDGRAYAAEAGQPVDTRAIIPTLASGPHHLVAVCGADTLRQDFTTFTRDDRRVVEDTQGWFYLSADRFPTDGSPVHLQLGAAAPRTHVLYTLLSGDTVLEDGCIDLADSALYRRDITYRPEYGDGVLLNFTWVKGGKMYEYSRTVTRPLPDQRLRMEWTSFRDRLTPGQKEEWTLRILRPDGTPAAASLMATLYDKALDAIVRHGWGLDCQRVRFLPTASWNRVGYGARSLDGSLAPKYLKDMPMDFTRLDAALTDYTRFYAYGSPKMKNSVVRGITRTAKAGDAKYESAIFAMADAPGLSLRESAPEPDPKARAEGLDQQVQVRENLAETAFFYPALQAGNDGGVSLRFTLPESVTTWRFMGMAHDREMRYGFLYGEAVAQKTVMVQPHLPRFFRVGDLNMIATRIHNTADHPVDGTLRLTITSAASGQTLYSRQEKYTIAAGTTATVTIPYMPRPEADLLVCRIVAEGKGYSDGEQHYLPVISGEQRVINTVPFTLREAGRREIDLSTLFPKGSSRQTLTAEYTENPAWLMVQSLPQMAQPATDNAISLATAYYANMLGSRLAQSVPGIRETMEQWRQEQGTETSLASALAKNQELRTLTADETPWLRSAEAESAAKRSLAAYLDENTLESNLTALIGRIARLQTSTGAIRWFPGFSGDLHVTLSVAETLARLGEKTALPQQAREVLDRALTCLDREMDDVARRIRESEKQGKQARPYETACHYLYVHALAGRKPTATTRFLTDRIGKYTKAYTIYGKARLATALALNGSREKAREMVESARQYTVYREETGRYYDTPRAQYSWCDYRVPTQTAVIEALRRVTPEDAVTVEEMQRWLLQEKRTTSWTSPIAAVDATYAFFADGFDRLAASLTAPHATLKVDGRRMDTSRPTAALGYVKGSMEGVHHKTLTIEKETAGTSWGAAYATFMQPASEIQGTESGMRIKREIIGADTLRVGDRVKVRITIEADRDYDFVQVEDQRAANMEPVAQTSGYRNGYYLAPKDRSTQYFFYKLGKGSHKIETEYYIDRAGRYMTGICTAQCAYSPEYTARQAAMEVVSTE